MEGLKPEDVVYGDQMGCTLNCQPTHALAPIGERAKGTVKGRRGKNQSTMSVIGMKGVLVSRTIEGAFNGLLVLDLIQELCRKLKRGQVLVLDNARIHKKYQEEMRAELGKVGCRLVYLPPYSPQMNPIEMTWSKVKALVRKDRPQERLTLVGAIHWALKKVRKSDITGWYSKAHLQAHLT